MRIPRTLATGTGIALIAVSALVITSSATAAMYNPVTFVTAADVDTSSGPANSGTSATTWTDSAGSSALVSGLDGLTMSSDASFANQFADPIDAGSGTPFTDFASSVDLAYSAVDDVYATIYYSIDGNEGVLTSDSSIGASAWNDPTAVWNSSTLISGGDTGNLSYFDARIVIADAPQVLYAAGFDGGGDGEVSITLASFSLNGTTYLFTPTPVPTFTKVTITAAEFAKSGYSAQTTGFLPGEPVQAVFATSNSGGDVGDPMSATAEGAAGYTYVPSAANAVPGTYRLFLASVYDGYRDQVFEFEVVEELAATGVEPLGLIATAGVLGIIGAGILAAIAIRRKRIASV